MVGADIRLDNQSLQRLQHRLNLIRSMPLQGLIASVAAEVVSQTQRRISSEKESPDGTAWEAWSPQYAATRHSGQSLLMNEGNLVDIVANVSGNGAVVGSNLVYAATQQFGDASRNIKARPYLGINQDNEDALLAIVDAWIDGFLGLT